MAAAVVLDGTNPSCGSEHDKHAICAPLAGNNCSCSDLGESGRLRTKEEIARGSSSCFRPNDVNGCTLPVRRAMALLPDDFPLRSRCGMRGSNCHESRIRDQLA